MTSIDFSTPPEAIQIDAQNGFLRSDSPNYLRNPLGYLLIFEPPSKRHYYHVGVDPSVGIMNWSKEFHVSEKTTNNACIQVVRSGDPDVQVAEWTAPVDSYTLAQVVNSVGRLYGGSHEDGQAHVIIEVEPGPGHPVQRELWEKYGYTNLYMRRYLDKPIMSPTGAFGWSATSQRAVRDLWIMGLKHIIGGHVKIRSKWLVDEMRDVEFDILRLRGEAVTGRKDDRVSAFLLALWAANEWTGEIESNATRDITTDTEPPNLQCRDVSFDDMIDEYNSQILDIWSRDR